MNYLLGIDAGQTVTKAVLFDAAGNVHATARAGAHVDSPHPRWQERDMDSLWRQTGDAVRSCLASAGVSGVAVAAVGLCAHCDGVYPVDAELRPTRAAILATDSRAASYVAAYRADGRAEEALPLTGQSPFAGSPAALYAWLRDNEPDTLRRSAWLLYCKDWLRLQLTGEVGTDLTDGSASFTDVNTQRYSAAALALFGLENCAEKLPPIHDSVQVAGHVTTQAADQTGLAAGTPVVFGAHDADAAALGVGAIDVGAISSVMGTFAISQIVSDDVRLDHRWQARNFLEPGRWLHMSTSPASASNFDWAVRQLGPHDTAGKPDFVAAVHAASQIRAEHAPLFHPFLYGSPHAGSLGASFVDIQGWHSRDHLLRAVLDGVVFNHRTHLDALATQFALSGPMRVCGGGAASPWWTQLLSDVVQAPVEITDAAEAGARGAAALAGIGTGLYDSMSQAAAATVRVVRRHDPAAAPVLEERYRRYRASIAQRLGDASA